MGIDVGGTFTDFVVVDGNGLRVHKLSTTPDDQSRAIVAGLRALGLAGTEVGIVHGMTVATNALLERRGARTALITTAGFGDVLVIGRQNRPELYSLSQERPRPLVEDALRLEAAERVDQAGAVLAPLDEAALDGLAEALGRARAESLAICFLFSFRNPAHERAAAARIAARLPDLPISLSSDILPEYREYERTATTVINAYVQPLVARYLARLEATLGAEGAPGRVRIMQSNGGAIGLGEAARQPARLVLSGPAGGVVGAFVVAQQAHALEANGGDVNLLTIDMGGTSTDVALCPGAIPTTAESTISDLPLRLPAIDIHTVGAGGGSVAFVDAGGGLRVGPRSAGAVPGPACYGRGGMEATVTDANVVLGRLDPAGFLGGHGDVALDVDAARRVLAELGARFGLTAEQAALGVIRVANATMERALRRVSVERGHDPRRFTLLPFGGAGPLHACDLAAALGIRRVLVPPFPGVLSAYGMLAAGVATDASQSLLRRADELRAGPGELAQAVAALEERVRAVLARDGVAAPALSAALDARYVGQSYELTVPLSLPVTGEAVAAAVAAFHAAHAQRYGYALDSEGLEAVEVVTVRVRGGGPGLPLGTPPAPLHDPDASAAQTGVKPAWFGGDAPLPAATYDRARLLPGHRLPGPALIFQFDTTTVVAPGWAARVDALGNLHLENI